jgi:hypothetical protein
MHEKPMPIDYGTGVLYQWMRNLCQLTMEPVSFTNEWETYANWLRNQCPLPMNEKPMPKDYIKSLLYQCMRNLYQRTMEPVYHTNEWETYAKGLCRYTGWVHHHNLPESHLRPSGSWQFSRCQENMYCNGSTTEMTECHPYLKKIREQAILKWNHNLENMPPSHPTFTQWIDIY